MIPSQLDAGTQRGISPTPADPGQAVEAWFQRQGWKIFSFQREAWRAAEEGRSGLVHAPTGMGKTYAVAVPPMLAWLSPAQARTERAWREAPPLQLLWVTPLRALAGDTVRALRHLTQGLGLPWTVEARTGDTPASVRARQRKRLPSVLVTTPESLSLLLSYEGAKSQFQELRSVVVDEWHELLSTKRGVQTELGLARLRQWRPGMQTWGLSATLHNLEEAARTLVGVGRGEPRIISGGSHKKIRVETVVPERMESFPWSGHLGLSLLPEVIRAVEGAGSTLVFTNTRSQTEAWFRALREARPDWKEVIDLHHGSLERASRKAVEDRLREGSLKAVVCTSSLDLGVDFSPVEQVIQIGGPKGIARLLQRAGRSGHQPGAVSRVLCVPTLAFELLEYAAARNAMARGVIEPRRPLAKPLDLLAQHLVTIASGEGFQEAPMFREVRQTHAYASLTREEWDWVMGFVIRGGTSLQAYPQFRRVRLEEGRYRVASAQICRLHRVSVGTIISDQAVQVRYLNGRSLGTVEESFIARLRRGDRFVFAGKTLEFLRLHQMTAHVRTSRRGGGVVPSWDGGKSPLSSELAWAVREELETARLGRATPSHEVKAMLPVLEIQREWSSIPALDELLIETTRTREGVHWFVFPFAGRLVHEGLAALVAYRLAQRHPLSIVTAITDYGFELLPATPVDLDEEAWRELLSPQRLVEDLRGCLNTTELARRQFRGIARVAGLVFQGYPGAPRSMRQFQASSGLYFEVFEKYDPNNLLLEQSKREVLEHQLEIARLRATLQGCATQRLRLNRTHRLTPFAFPLWAEMIRGQVSSESWSTRVQRMAADLEASWSATTTAPHGRGLDATPAVG